MSTIIEEAPVFGSLVTATPAIAFKGATSVHIAGKSPCGGAVSKVEYIPTAEVVGTETNFTTLKVINKGKAGSGSTVIAELAFSKNTVTAPAFQVKGVPLSEVAKATEVAEGDVLELTQVVTGEGLAVPVGQVIVTVEREEVTEEAPGQGQVKQPVA